MEFHQNSTVILDVYLWNASGIPLEYCFKIPAFFLEGFNRGLFGGRKWQYAKLDDIDLLCEISIFSSCKIDGLCRVCSKHLRWCIEILMTRWDFSTNIDFYSALEVAKNNRQFFNDSLKFSFDKSLAKELIRRK